MSAGQRRIQILSGVVIVLGLMGVRSKNVEAMNLERATCDFCATGCPSSLIDWCNGKPGCNSTGAQCRVESCQGVDYVWYEYRIICGSAE